jgi:DNA-binding Lrp family transcriptional regulator
MLDLKNRQILYELSCNARIPAKALAKKMGLSVSSIVYRLKSLYEKKIILGTSVIVDSYKLGYEGYRIYFKFFSTTTQKEKEILNWLIDEKAAAVVGLSEGDADVLVQSWVKKRKEFEDMFYEFKKRYKDCIDNLIIDMYVGTYYFTKRHLIEGTTDNQIITIGKQELEEYDELDLKIIELLNQDARLSVLLIAQKLGKSPSTISFRLRNLENKKIICGYTVNINYELLGIEYYKLGIILTKNVSERQLVSFTSSIKQSVFIDKSLCEFDFEPNLEVHSHAELLSIIERIKNEFGGIRRMNIFKIRNYLKFRYGS